MKYPPLNTVNSLDSDSDNNSGAVAPAAYNKPVRLIFAGTPAVALPAFERLVSEHNVVAVLTREPAPQGRKRTLTPSPVHQAAQEHGIPVLTPRTLKDPDVLTELKSFHPDAVAVVAYGKLVPQAALDIPTFGWFNLHFSALPRWRGAAPVQYALAAGDTTIATTVFKIDAGLDTGMIVSSIEHNIDPSVTSGELLDHLACEGAAQFSSALSSIAAGTAHYTKQVGTPTFAPTLSTRDSEIDWALDAHTVANRIRAYTPEPSAWTMLGATRVKIGPVIVTDEKACAALPELMPGEIYIAKDVYVGTGTRPVKLSVVTPAGKKEMTARDWARGLHGNDLRFGLGQESAYE